MSYQDKPLLPGNQLCQIAPVKLQLITDQSVLGQLHLCCSLPHGMCCREHPVYSSTSVCFQKDGAKSLNSLSAAVSFFKAWAVPQPPQFLCGAVPAGKACPPLPALPKGSTPGITGDESLREVPALPGLQDRAPVFGRHFTPHSRAPVGQNLGPSTLLKGMRRLVPLARGSLALHPERDSRRRVRDPLASSAPPSFPQHICFQESAAFPLFKDTSMFLPTQRGWCPSASRAKACSVSELSQPGPAEASSKSETFGARAQVPEA